MGNAVVKSKQNDRMERPPAAFVQSFFDQISQGVLAFLNLWPAETASRFPCINECSTPQTWKARVYPIFSGTAGFGTGGACSLPGLRKSRVLASFGWLVVRAGDARQVSCFKLARETQ